jgi:hypothetical protein
MLHCEKSALIDSPRPAMIFASLVAFLIARLIASRTGRPDEPDRDSSEDRDSRVGLA